MRKKEKTVSNTEKESLWWYSLSDSTKNLWEDNEADFHIRNLISLMEGLNRNVPFQETLDYLFDAFSQYIPYTHIGVALLDGKVVRCTYAATSPEHDGLRQRLLGYSTDIRTTSLLQVIKAGDARVINDLETYLADKPLRPYNRFLLEAGVHSSITFPLLNGQTPVGIVFFSSQRKYAYTKEHVRFLHVLAGSLMLALERGILMENMILTSTLSMAALTEERDVSTGAHLARIKNYSRFLAEQLYQQNLFSSTLNFTFVGDIERFSPLHDIGKVAIRDEILLKPGKLNAEEYRIMQSHTVYGAKVLHEADEKLKRFGRNIYQMGIEIARSHHEKWDGGGYPDGLKGEKIPLSARIVAICDVFDALMSTRVYKSAYPIEKTMEIMRQESASHFDPVIFDVFDRNAETFLKRCTEITGDAYLPTPDAPSI